MTLGLMGYIDDATYWPSPTENGYGGVTYDAPRLIKTKWEDRVEQFTDINGEDSQSMSIVYVLEYMDEGGYLARGDYTSEADPTNLKKAYYIKRVDVVRDLRGLNEEIRVFL